jgi:hypothetical protein
MSREMFLWAAKICLGVFLAYAVLFGVVSYLDFYYKYSELPRYPFGYYSYRYYYALLLLPFAAGYSVLRSRKKEEQVLIAFNFMATAFLLLIIFWLISSIFYSLYKPFAYQPESIKLLYQFLKFLFHSSLGYFLYAPLFFSLFTLKRNLFYPLLPVILLLLFRGIEGMKPIFSIAEQLPRFLALPLVLVFFMPIFEPPLPLAGIGLVYNFYLGWRWAEVHYAEAE